MQKQKECFVYHTVSLQSSTFLSIYFCQKFSNSEKHHPPTNHFEADRKGLILAALPSSLRSSEPLNLRCWVALLTINPSASRQSSHLYVPVLSTQCDLDSYLIQPEASKGHSVDSAGKLVEPHRASLCIDQPGTTMDDKVVNFTKPKCLPELFGCGTSWLISGRHWEIATSSGDPEHGRS